jgi:hypothetical protein
VRLKLSRFTKDVKKHSRRGRNVEFSAGGRPSGVAAITPPRRPMVAPDGVFCFAPPHRLC